MSRQFVNPWTGPRRGAARGRLLGLLLGLTFASLAQAQVVVRHGHCAPDAPPPLTEVCAEDPAVVPDTAFLSGPSGSLVAGGEAGPELVAVRMSNFYGGSANVDAQFQQTHTLVGPAGGTVSFQALLDIDVSRNNNSNSLGAGFKLGSGTFYPGAGSWGVTPGTGSTGDFSASASRSLELMSGDSVDLWFAAFVLGAGGTQLEVQARLDFAGLPAGYRMVTEVPEAPASVLMLAGLAALVALVAHRRRQRPVGLTPGRSSCCGCRPSR